VSVWNAESCSNHSFVTWATQGERKEEKKKEKIKKIVKMWNVNFSLCSNRQNRNRTKTPIAAKWLRKVALVPSLSLQSLSLALRKVSPAARVRKLYPTAALFFSPPFGCRISISLRASFTTTFLASNGCNSIQPSRNTLIAGLNRCSRTLSGLP